MSKHIHNALDSFHKPIRRNSTCSDENHEIGVDYNKNTKATSIRHVYPNVHHPWTFQQAVDVSNHVHSLLNTSHNTKRRQSTRFNETEVDYVGNTKDTSVRHVPPSRNLIHAAGRHITMPTASILAVDVSRHVHNLTSRGVDNWLILMILALTTSKTPRTRLGDVSLPFNQPLTRQIASTMHLMTPTT